MNDWHLQPKHPCAMPGCTRQIAKSYVMCIPHWRLLDPGTADTLWFARSHARNAWGPKRAMFAQARYQQLLQDAIAQIQAKAQPSNPPQP